MPDEDKNFGGSLVLDFRKWWRHVKTIYCYTVNFFVSCLLSNSEVNHMLGEWYPNFPGSALRCKTKL